jgi:hypothetical protein
MSLNHLPKEKGASDSEKHAYLRLYSEDNYPGLITSYSLQVQYRPANILAGNKMLARKTQQVPRNSAAPVRTTLVPNTVAGGRR